MHRGGCIWQDRVSGYQPSLTTLPDVQRGPVYAAAQVHQTQQYTIRSEASLCVSVCFCVRGVPVSHACFLSRSLSLSLSLSLPPPPPTHICIQPSLNTEDHPQAQPQLRSLKPSMVHRCSLASASPPLSHILLDLTKQQVKHLSTPNRTHEPKFTCMDPCRQPHAAEAQTLLIPSLEATRLDKRVTTTLAAITLCWPHQCCTIGCLTR
jgi:hypothetical protein